MLNRPFSHHSDVPPLDRRGAASPARPLDDRLRKTLRAARRVVVLTGAGVSAESGIPTFREAQHGLWAQFDPEKLATLEGFLCQPRQVWAWYTQRRQVIAQAEPNAAHRALADWQQRLHSCHIVTQNVDGLHQQAGSDTVTELHGNIHRDRPLEGPVPKVLAADPKLPRCPETGTPLRPDVVWFGEALPAGTLEQAGAAIRNSDLLLSIGSSSLVQPAASLPLEALERGIPVLEINPEPTPLTPVADWSLRGKAAEIVPQLVAAATNR
ncbi:NAD-dependent protein deacylase [Halorhodospira abdelmalekii]|uniref:SIR2 family NAD-dependent protein deacylase n=1 Tax=Halorhodospira abdelmalekii TaxID=421629 RepID=UPI0019068809|nr:NAD-dependent protein deacylase [Halorhodospira abdelmalekii]MBK1735959.1 NAD-dependent protein deacylase [Halorhodospira abdelmalekii]